MKYYAKTDIGGYKAGEEVPAEKAMIWQNMYLESPVELSEKKPKQEESSNPEGDDDKPSLKDELVKINGIGKKTAEDIVAVYPEKEGLIKALKSTEEVPFRDDVVDLLREEYLN